MHTNFDGMGMADAAADMMELKNSQILNVSYDDGHTQEGCGRFGNLSNKMSLDECAMHIKKIFQLDLVRVFGDKEKQIENVAIMPGSGADMIKDSLKANVDLMITGDMKHHEGIDSNAQGLAIIDAGHFGLEKLFVSYVKNYLNRELPQVNIHIPNQKPPFWSI